MVAEADRQVDLGIAAQNSERPLDAVAAYEKALSFNPFSLDAHMNLGNVLAELGRPKTSVHHLQRALALGSKLPKVHADAARSLVLLGRWDLALPAVSRALKADSQNAELRMWLGFIQLENGNREQAIAAATKASELQPGFADAHYLLHRALYDDSSLAPALAPLKRAVACAPDHLLHRFCLATLLDSMGDSGAAEALFASFGPDTFQGAVASWRYIQSKRTAATRIFTTTRDALLAGLSWARPDGYVLEFGVRLGISTRWIAEQAGTTVHGFDGFEGLPERWHIQEKGVYSTHGEVPELPSNVEVHVGWFDATLPKFIAEHEGAVRFVNVDCDLYSSTKVVLDQLAARIGPGTVLVFDEYLINDQWKQDEYKAFQEAVVQYKWQYEYLAFSIPDGQAVVRITGVDA